MSRVQELARSRGVVGVTDSGVTAALSLFVVLMATRIGGTETLGLVTLASTVVLLAVGFFRMLIGLPALVVGAEDRGQRRSSVLALGFGFSVMVLALAALLAGFLGSTLPLIIGVWAALAVAQDTQRYVAMLDGRYYIMLALDVLLLTCSIALGALARTASELILWLTTALILALAAGLPMLRPWIRVRVVEPITFWRTQLASRAWPLALDGLVYTFAIQGLLWVVVARSSVAVVGELRLAMLFSFPYTVIMAGLSNRMIQRVSEAPQEGRKATALRQAWWLLAGGLALGLLLVVTAPIMVGIAAAQSVEIPLNAIVLSVANSVVLLACLPLFALAVSERRIATIAVLRTIAGTVLILLVATTQLGTSPGGAAAATVISSILLAGGILVSELRRTRIHKARGEVQHHHAR